ncbi:MULTISPECIES: sulfur carrier protein ThiS [unclassified Brevibacterium]|uniref:sulfur carrier protein ThiS n=1 Tax=unclassified Brevibacterium TaxID=2614124 RepID=UPI0010923B70|nr:sulfur carrier protein ThiS [Brevibacterium sp. S22]TGD33091.1 sulfur carrier protein ThiS [Brevibacterium sp. S22]HJF76212.1 sulfur carrier protein ThiS [Brevibacterium linens]
MTDREHPPTIVLNGEHHELPGATSALDLIADVTGRELQTDGTPADGGRLGIALAVDGEVIRRGAWSGFALADGHTVDIVTAVQGG